MMTLNGVFVACLVANGLLEAGTKSEIIDSREHRWRFQHLNAFKADIDDLWERNNTYKDYPPLSDLYLIPPQDVINNHHVIIRQYIRELEDRYWLVGGHERHIVELQILRCKELRVVYDYMHDARSEYIYNYVRRQSLHLLRELVGESNYYRGMFPTLANLFIEKKY